MKKPLADPEVQAKLLDSMRATFQAMVIDHELVRGTFAILPMVKTPSGMISIVECRFVVTEKKTLLVVPPQGLAIPS